MTKLTCSLMLTGLVFAAGFDVGAQTQPAADATAMSVGGGPVDADAVKARFLVSFMKFVQWPPSATGRLLICTASHEAFERVIERLVRGQSVDGRPLATSRLREGDDPADRDVLYVAAHRQREQAELFQRITKPVVTVGESAQFLLEGGIVQFYVENNLVRFQFNHKGAEAVGLRISSKR